MKLLVLDGNSIINRAFFGIRPLTTKDGQFTNAIHGFMNMMLKIEEDTQPDCVAVAFDMRAPTFRHKMYDGYKAKRKGMPSELASQLDPLKKLLASLGYTILSAEGWEADDILGTLAQRCRETENTCVIATGDRDTFQLIGDGVSVRLLSTVQGRPEATLYDENAIMEHYGVKPIQLIEVKAIQGDSSDNIPGVPGIGEKGALELIKRFGTVDYIYSHLAELDIKEGMRKKLTEGKDSAYLSRELGTVRVDAPVSLEISDYKKAEPDTEEATRILISLEMFKLLERLGLKNKKEISKAKKATAEQPKETEALFDPPLEEYLPLIKKSGSVCFISSFDEGRLTGAALSVQDKVIMLGEGSVKSFIEGVLEDSSIEKLTYDIKLLRKALPKLSFDSFTLDAMLGAYLLDPSATDYDLEHLLAKYTAAVIPPLPLGLRMSALAAPFERLCRVLLAELEQNGQLELLRTVELPLAVVLADMELLGVEVDSEGIESFGHELCERLDSLQKEIFESAGCEFNINSPKQLGEVLFGKLMLPGGKKTKTGYSTSADVLDSLRGLSPVVDKILEYRSLSKLNSTYCIGLLKTIGADKRIHSSFNQTETRTGRISSAEPNLQNIPVRTELGARMRRFFVAREGCVFIDADYSQIELRVLAHCSGDERMITGFASGEDIHRITASQVFGVPLEAVTASMRSNAKAVNFGIVYGISAFSLGKDIGVPQPEAAAYIKSYLNTYASVDAYMKGLIASAKDKGYAETIMGRRRYLPELGASNFNTRSFGERVARNMPIQGTAADIIKIAMVRVHKRLEAEGLRAKLVLQIHDELIIEAPEDEAQRAHDILLEEMRSAASLKVPLEVDGNIGKTWYDAKG